MNTLFFKYAIEIEKTRSISQAAENLYMAQPNLSKAVKELEDSLGYTIFERTSKGVIPTENGKEFLLYAKNIVSQLGKMESISDAGSKNVQRFNISMSRGSYIAYAVTNFVSCLNLEESIHLNIQETNSMQTIENVASGSSRLGIIRYKKTYEHYFRDYLESKHLDFESVWEFEYLIVLSKLHELANVKKVERDVLKKYIEIVYGDTSIPYLAENETGRKNLQSGAKSQIYVYERANQFDLLSRIPSTYMWVSPIPQNLLSLYDLTQRKCSFSGNLYRDVLIYPHGLKFTDMDRKFIDKLYESKNEVSFENYL